MNTSHTENEQLDLRRMLGVILLLFALSGLYWVADAIIQLWNSPRSVSFVSLFIDLLEEDQEPVFVSKDGTQINLPASWPVVVGLFLSIVLISSAGLLIRSFLTSALALLFPGSHNIKGALAVIIERMLEKRGTNR